MEPKLEEKTMQEAFRRETDRNLSILLQLQELQLKLTSVEKQLVELNTTSTGWSKNAQSSELKLQELQSRVTALEEIHHSRSSKEWELFKMALPHLVTWAIMGALIYFKK